MTIRGIGIKRNQGLIMMKTEKQIQTIVKNGEQNYV